MHTLGMLAALPEKDLVARMGQEGRRLWQLARGERPHLFQPVEPPLSAGRAHGARFSRGTARLAAVCRRRHARSAHRARQCAPGCAGRGQPHAHARRRRHARAHGAAGVADQRQAALDQAASSGSWKRIRRRRRCLPSRSMRSRERPARCSSGLFSPQLPEASRLDVTLARIRAVVGEENVGRAALVDTHAPDGFRMEAFK